MKFGRWLKAERQAQGILQTQLSNMSGVNNNTISNCERDAMGIMFHNAESLADVLGFDLLPVRKGEKEQAVTQIIEQVKEDMCDKYCRYTKKSYEYLDKDEEYEMCQMCPLNRL